MTRSRIQRLLLEAIGNYMRQQVSIEGVFVRITKRTITPDLDIVHVYLGFLGSDNLNKAALLADMMRLHHWPVRSYVATKLRHMLRRI